jgi:hypothetical protein
MTKGVLCACASESIVVNCMNPRGLKSTKFIKQEKDLANCEAFTNKSSHLAAGIGGWEPLSEQVTNMDEFVGSIQVAQPITGQQLDVVLPLPFPEKL